jgi:tetratricopeptide (TPR) repeat protein
MRCSWLFVPALGLVLAMPGAVHAQSAGPVPDGAAGAGDAAAPGEDDLARTHYDDGQAAAKKGDWQAAYTSYRAAYAIKEEVQTAGALGDAAQHLGKYRDAAEYLTLYLQKAPDTLPASARAAAEKALADASSRVARVTITAPAGAEIFVDHVIVGKAPLGREVFVEPGKREIEARSERETAKQTVAVEKGKSDTVTLVFGAPVGPGPSKTAEPNGSAGPGPLAPAATSSTTPPPGEPRREVLVAGGAIAAGAAAVGAILLGVSRARAADEEALRNGLVQLGQGNVCAAAARDSRCDQVKDAAAGTDALTNTGAWLLLGAGAAAAVTGIYYLVTRRPADSRVEAAAVVAPRGGGGTLSVRW